MSVIRELKSAIVLMSLLVLVFIVFVSLPVTGFSKKEISLSFNRDRSFKIVQFTDIQDDQDIDPRTVDLIEAVLDDQKPGLVVFTGDNVTSGPQTEQDVKTAIDSFVQPVDSRKIPWFITFGNHDEDHTPLTGMDEEAQLAYYMSYKYNINKVSPPGVYGTGNMHLLIRGSRNKQPVFGIWGIDSGSYAPDTIDAQSLDKLLKWDWIQPSQVMWYLAKSKMLEKKYHKKVPSFMFFHIPLFEFDAMWKNPQLHAVVGECNESVCSGSFNSGLFSAILHRGDVKGVFVGHDHVNDFIGNYYGIYLGYAANAGFGTYGLGGAENNRLRGARVFILNEDNPEQFKTYMVYARNYGIQ